MARLLVPILLMATPFVLYGLWRVALRGRRVGPASSEVLLLIGAAVLVATLSLVILLREPAEEYPDDVRWIPPRLEDGRITPGRFVSRDDDASEEAAADGTAPPRETDEDANPQGD